MAGAPTPSKRMADPITLIMTTPSGSGMKPMRRETLSEWSEKAWNKKKDKVCTLKDRGRRRSSLLFIGRDWYPWDVAPKKKEGRRGGAKKWEPPSFSVDPRLDEESSFPAQGRVGGEKRQFCSSSIELSPSPFSLRAFSFPPSIFSPLYCTQLLSPPPPPPVRRRFLPPSGRRCRDILVLPWSDRQKFIYLPRRRRRPQKKWTHSLQW